jgi:hypothetical protein
MNEMMNWTELCEAADRETAQLKSEIDAGTKKWGNWTYNANKPPSIDHGRGLAAYEISLDRIDNDAKLGTWLLHLAEKGWVTADDLGNLVLALRDLEQVEYHRVERLESGC